MPIRWHRLKHRTAVAVIPARSCLDRAKSRSSPRTALLYRDVRYPVYRPIPVQGIPCYPGLLHASRDTSSASTAFYVLRTAEFFATLADPSVLWRQFRRPSGGPGRVVHCSVDGTVTPRIGRSPAAVRLAGLGTLPTPSGLAGRGVLTWMAACGRTSALAQAFTATESAGLSCMRCWRRLPLALRKPLVSQGAPPAGAVRLAYWARPANCLRLAAVPNRAPSDSDLTEAISTARW